ncbi:MAG TPA: aldehyde dehydrogenase family protein, partial [Ignavibacteria bacterium]
MQIRRTVNKMPRRLPVPKMYKLFIGGKFTRTESERYLSAMNSATGEKMCNISRGSRKDVRNAVVAARNAHTIWAEKTGYERGQILYRLAEMLEGRKEQFAHEISISTAGSKAKALKEAEKCVDRI